MRTRHQIKEILTPKKEKKLKHKLYYNSGVWTLKNHKNTLTVSKQFTNLKTAKMNIKALKRVFEQLTYQEIDLAFVK